MLATWKETGEGRTHRQPTRLICRFSFSHKAQGDDLSIVPWLEGLQRLPKNLVFSSRLHSVLRFPRFVTQRVTNSASGFLSGLTIAARVQTQPPEQNQCSCYSSCVRPFWSVQEERERERESTFSSSRFFAEIEHEEFCVGRRQLQGFTKCVRYGSRNPSFLRNFRFFVSNFLPAFFSLVGRFHHVAEVAIILRKDGRLAKFGYKQDMLVNYFLRHPLYFCLQMLEPNSEIWRLYKKKI
jgi:hypothetical protein